MVSPSKELDKKLRQSFLEIVMSCLMRGDVEKAKLFGAESERLKKRIEMYDYEHEDAVVSKQNALVKRFIKITTPTCHKN